VIAVGGSEILADSRSFLGSEHWVDVVLSRFLEGRYLCVGANILLFNIFGLQWLTLQIFFAVGSVLSPN
jgi:hypothetical protein